MKPAALAFAALATLVLVPRLAPAATPPVAPPVAPLRAIAIAEDQRRWSDGELRGWLAHADAAVRARAALAVGRLQDTTAVEALLPLLRDGAPEVRREAAFALGQIGHRSARPALVTALADRDGETAELALEALGKLGDRAATPLVVARLGAGEPRTRAFAAVALWRLADTSACGALLAHLGDPEPEARWRMVYALEKLPACAARIVPAVTPLLGDRDALVRAHAARTLGRTRSPAAVPALLGALTDAEPAVVVNALRGLQGVADSTSPRVLPEVAVLLAHADPYVRVTAATVLAERFAWASAATSDSVAARVALDRGLADPDAATRGACARAYVARFPLHGLVRTQPLRADSSVYVRVALLDGLRAAGDEAYRSPKRIGEEPTFAAQAAATLESAFEADHPLLERMTAAEIAGQLIGRTHAKDLAPLLARLRGEVDETTNQQASASEPHLGPRTPQPPSPAGVLVLASAAGALADAGDTASVARLTRAYAAFATYPEADARVSLRDALRQLAGRAVADSIERAHPAPEPRAADYGAEFETAPRERGAILHTSAGEIEWRFLATDAPQTVRNFVTLAKKHYFDGLVVHRVVPDFVIQDGDPTGTGSGGPGYSIRCEYNHWRYDVGMVGMALSGKDTGGSQWFVTLSPQPHLDGRYTIFARVVRGLDVAKRITQGAVITRVDILP